MGLFSSIRKLLFHEAEKRASEVLTDMHWSAVLETLLKEFPAQTCSEIVRDFGWEALVRRVGRRACERLIEHGL